MPVDSFKFLPRLIATFYQLQRDSRLPPAPQPIPWTPLRKPLQACTVGLVTSAGLYLRQTQPPFDLAREQAQPTWGDPTYRAIPLETPQEAFGLAHLHLNGADILQDVNIVLPLQRLQELTALGEIRGAAAEHYSFMGYQGFPPDTTAWAEVYGPEVAARFLQQGVECVLLTPT